MSDASAELAVSWDRPRVMGIVNVTPDSFSDGGLWSTTDAAINHGRTLLAHGADILDIGGESTRPGATRPLLAEELDRVIPVIRALAHESAVVSVDTMRAEVAEDACEAGAVIINDVSGGLADPDILRVAAAHGATYIAMHWRAHSDVMTSHATYDGSGGVVAAVRDELSQRLDAAIAAGIDPALVVLDPGLGFAKTAAHNWTLLAHLADLSLGQRLLVGSSRKSFLGSLLADDEGTPRPVEDREHANVALTTIVADAGVWGVRVHDVRASRDALRVVTRLNEESQSAVSESGAL